MIVLGVTTAPRGDVSHYKKMMRATLESIKAAGWDTLHLYVEPHTPKFFTRGPSMPSLHTTTHAIRLGPWPNFLVALASLRREHPNEDYYAIFQDDIRVAKGCRRWLEMELSSGWPRQHDEQFILSLYTSCATKRGTASTGYGWFRSAGRYRDPVTDSNVDPNWLGVGACAIVLPRGVADRLLAVNPGSGCITKTDYHLSNFCIDEGLPWIQYYPSLVSHRGTISTLGQKWNRARHEAAWVSDLTTPPWRA